MKQIKPYPAKKHGIKRREFVQTASLGLAALSSPISMLSSLVGGTAMGIVVHSYATRWNAKTESKTSPPLPMPFNFWSTATASEPAGSRWW
nr:hypothetical protein [Haliscomenobacter sp.]